MINSGSKVNGITLAYTAKLSFAMRLTNISIQKINNSLLKIYGMVIIRFFIQDKFGRKNQFFDNLFLLANTSLKIVLEMLIFFFNNINIKFVEVEKLT